MQTKQVMADIGLKMLYLQSDYYNARNYVK